MNYRYWLDVRIQGILTGFLTGVILVVSGFGILALTGDYTFSFSGIATMHRHIPFLWLLDILPIIFSSVIFLVLNPLLKRISELENALVGEKKRIKSIDRLVTALVNNEPIPESATTDMTVRSIYTLQDNIKKKQEESLHRKEEADQRNWISEGIALFLDILRKNNQNLQQLSSAAISQIVKYTGANQGGFFIIQDDNPSDIHLEQTASYAYNRQKYAQRRVELNDGLIGSCIIEKQTLYLPNIPDGYVAITSGIGEATPSNLLVVPLINNEKVLGVIELASFKTFEQFQMLFIEEVAENIASYIASIKTSLQTSLLLQETQKQAKILSSQEVALRQNMEELHAMQEEAIRQGEQMASFTNAVNHTLIRAEFATDGTLIYGNTRFIYKLGYSGNAEVEGKHIFTFIPLKDRSWFDPVWNNLTKGGRHFEGYIRMQCKNGEDIWTLATYTCMRKEDNTTEKILLLAIDTTEQKRPALDTEVQADAINHFIINALLDREGNIIECNQKAIDYLTINQSENSRTTIFTLAAPESQKILTDAWNALSRNIPFQGRINFLTESKEIKEVQLGLFPLSEYVDTFSRVQMLAYPIVVLPAEVTVVPGETPHEGLSRFEEFEMRKKIQQKQLYLQNQYNTTTLTDQMLDSFPEAIVVIDANGIIQYVNKKAEKLWETKKEIVLGKQASILFPSPLLEQDEALKSLASGNFHRAFKAQRAIDISGNRGHITPCMMKAVESGSKKVPFLMIILSFR